MGLIAPGHRGVPPSRQRAAAPVLLRPGRGAVVTAARGRRSGCSSVEPGAVRPERAALPFAPSVPFTGALQTRAAKASSRAKRFVLLGEQI